jgi:hypothetical protein
MSRLKIAVVSYVLAFALVLIAGGSQATAGVSARIIPAVKCNWVPKLSPAPGASSIFSGVTTVSTNDAWAVGSYVNANGVTQTLIEQWNGTQWQVVPSPNVGTGNNSLSGVTALSANDIWAVGFYINAKGVTQTLIEQWNGTQWQVVPSPNAGTGNNSLSGVTAITVNDVWAVGSYVNASGVTQTLIEQWNGAQWQVVPSPNAGTGNNFLSGVTAISANDVWAVGFYVNANGVTQTLIEQSSGAQWQIVPSPSPGTYANSLNGVIAISANDVWAVGSYADSPNQSKTLIEQWNGASWKHIASPSPGSYANSLNGVAAPSANDVWAVGSYANSSGPSQTLYEQWNGSKWAVVSSPGPGTYANVLNGVANIVGSKTMWAVGYNSDSSGENRTLAMEPEIPQNC